MAWRRDGVSRSMKTVVLGAHLAWLGNGLGIHSGLAKSHYACSIYTDRKSSFHYDLRKI